MTPEQQEEVIDKGYYTLPEGGVVYPYENVQDKLLGLIYGELIKIRNLLSK